MCFEKSVPASVIGGNPSKYIRVSMATIPMGYVAATDLIQSAVRRTIFASANIDPGTEVRKDKPMPNSANYSLVYLDGFDFVRRVKQFTDKVATDHESTEHKAFISTCAALGLPPSPSKSVAATFSASILGGKLEGDHGLLWLGEASP